MGFYFTDNSFFTIDPWKAFLIWLIQLIDSRPIIQIVMEEKGRRGGGGGGGGGGGEGKEGGGGGGGEDSEE